MAYEIYHLDPPIKKPPRRKNLDELVTLAQAMNVGEAVCLNNSDAQIFRVILAAQGFDCATDGWRSPEKPKTLCFKLRKP